MKTDIPELFRQVDTAMIMDSTELKYIIVDINGKPVGIMFPKEFVHADMYRMTRMTYDREYPELLSAGFCICLMAPFLKVKTFGSSESLKTQVSKTRDDKPWESKAGDEKILAASYGVGPWTYIWPYEDKVQPPTDPFDGLRDEEAK